MVPTQDALDAFVRERFFHHFGHEDEAVFAAALEEYRSVKGALPRCTPVPIPKMTVS